SPPSWGMLLMIGCRAPGRGAEWPPRPPSARRNVPIRVNCPSCGRSGRVPDHAAGRVVACPACGFRYQLAAGPREPDRRELLGGAPPGGAPPRPARPARPAFVPTAHEPRPLPAEADKSLDKLLVTAVGGVVALGIVMIVAIALTRHSAAPAAGGYAAG